MKIGILTYHDTFNAGAFLQTYATFKHLSNLGYDVEVIDYCPMSGYIKERKTKIKTKQPFLGLKSLLTKRPFLKRYLKLSKKRIVSDDFVKSTAILHGYDAILVGADTVFEVKHKNVAFAPQIPNIYYLPDSIKCLKIAFAASADASDFSLLSDKQKNYVSCSLSDFDAISIRDSYTLKEVSKIVSNDYKLIFDPTFMIDFPRIEFADKLNLKKDFAILNIPNENLSRIFAEIFRKKGWQVVSPTRNKFADVNLNGRINPLEWAELHRLAKFTATDRFHGTIFSIKGGCPVISVDSLSIYKNQLSKKADMLQRLELEYLLLDYNTANNMSISALTNLVDSIINNWDMPTIEEKLSCAKKISVEFLADSLS